MLKIPEHNIQKGNLGELIINLASGHSIHTQIIDFKETQLTFILKNNSDFFDFLMSGDFIESGAIVFEEGQYSFGHCEVMSIDFHSLEHKTVTVIFVEASLPPKIEILDHIKSLREFKSIPTIRPSILNKNQRRRKQRLLVSKGEFIYANILIGDEKIKADVYDISVSGLALIIPKKIIIDENLLKKEIKLRLFLTTLNQYDINCLVCHIGNLDHKNNKIGLKIIDDHFQLINKAAIYNFHAMANLPLRNPIIGTMYKQRLYKEKVAIKLLAVSKQHARILVYDLEIILLPGMEIKANFFIGSKSNKPLIGEVIRILSITTHEIIFEIKLTIFPKEFEKDLVEHCLLNFNWSPTYLRSFGLECKFFSDVFKVRPIKFQEEYIEVLKLRFESYKNAKKIPDNCNFTDMVSDVDKFSKILGVFHRNTLIACVTLTMPENEDIILDTEKPLKNGLPKDFPKKTNLVEISRLCTHRNYRKGDLIIRFFEHIYREMAISRREYIITSTEKKLWPLYKGIGMKKTGIGYQHPTLDNIWHDIIIVHESVGHWSRGISLLRWHYLYRSMGQYMYESGDLPMSKLHRLWIKFRSYCADKVISLLRFFGAKIP